MTAAPRILVVDDEEDIRDFVDIKLSSAGLEVLLATDGSDALLILADEQVDLVVLDMMMADVSGMEVLSQLRSGGRNKDVPVIIITARAQPADIERGLAAGASDYVTKPFSPQELLLRINAALTRVPTRADVRTSHS